MLMLTNDMLLDDIAGFEQRIQAAREKLDALPTTAIDNKDLVAQTIKKHELESEISHVKKLIGYAKEALEGV